MEKLVGDTMATDFHEVPNGLTDKDSGMGE